MYQSVLDTHDSDIPTTRSFFELGGNSLQIYQLLNALNEEFNIKLTVKQVLDNPSIQALSAQIERLDVHRSATSPTSFALEKTY